MAEPERTSRTIHPFQKIVRSLPKSDSDSRILVPFEKIEVEDDTEQIMEEAETPDPKEESVPESVPSSTSTPTGEPSESETTAPVPADKDTGKLKENDSSSQSSSSEKSPGWSEPPVPGAPPTSESSPTLPTPGSQKKDNPPTSAK